MQANRRTLLRSSPVLVFMSSPLWLTACQPKPASAPQLQPLPEGLREQAWSAEASAGVKAQVLQQHAHAARSQLEQGAGHAFKPLLQLQAAPEVDMNRIADAYAQRLGDGWSRFDDQRLDTTAISWRRGEQALLLAWTQKPGDGAQPTRLVLLGSNFAQD